MRWTISTFVWFFFVKVKEYNDGIITSNFKEFRLGSRVWSFTNHDSPSSGENISHIPQEKWQWMVYFVDLQYLLLSSPTNHHIINISSILHLTSLYFTKGLILHWLHRYLTTSSLPLPAALIKAFHPLYKQKIKNITSFHHSHFSHSIHISSSTRQILHNLQMTSLSSYENGSSVILSIQNHIILTIHQTHLSICSIPAPSSSTNLFTSSKSPL